MDQDLDVELDVTYPTYAHFLSQSTTTKQSKVLNLGIGCFLLDVLISLPRISADDFQLLPQTSDIYSNFLQL